MGNLKALISFDMYRFLSFILTAISLWLAQAGCAIATPTSDYLRLAVTQAIATPILTPQPRLSGFEPAEIQGAAAVEMQWLIVIGLLLTGGTVSWGVFQDSRERKWQHIEFLHQAIREFEQDEEIHNALKILDFEEYRDYHLSQPANTQPFSFRVTNDLLCNALASHDQRARAKQQIDHHQTNNNLDPAELRTYQIETTLRDWFNKMLNGLEHFGYFIESGLFTAKELEPWLNYWIKLIADPIYRRPGSSKVYDALYSYIHHSGFFGVQKLFERFGYRILPSPYQDSDLRSLSLALKPSRQSRHSPFSRLAPQPVSSFNTSIALVLAKAAYLAYQDKQFVAEVVERWGQALQQPSSSHTSPCAQLALANAAPVEKTAKKAAEKAAENIAEEITEKITGEATEFSDPSQPQKDSFVRQNFRYFNNRGRDTQAYMFRTDTFVVLAFRGSQEPKDWLTNVTTQLCSFTLRKGGVTTLSSYQGKVHTGFFLAWASIEDAVLAQIDRWRSEQSGQTPKLPPLYITGHSLGGALATMAAAALSDYGVDVAGVYTFGQPRVGDRTFTNQLNAHTHGKVFRFVNNNDIVPHVPPPFSIRNPTRLYGHVGAVKYFNAGGTIVIHSRHLSRLIDSSWGLLKGAIGAQLDLISDHKMEYYISHLDRALKEEAEEQATQMLAVKDPKTHCLENRDLSATETDESLHRVDLAEPT